MTISCGNWQDALQNLEIEFTRTGKTHHAVEYLEKDSPDNMTFYECADSATLAMLQANYKVTRIDTLKGDKK